MQVSSPITSRSILPYLGTYCVLQEVLTCRSLIHYANLTEKARQPRAYTKYIMAFAARRKAHTATAIFGNHRVFTRDVWTLQILKR
jgi:hypothetical protein